MKNTFDTLNLNSPFVKGRGPLAVRDLKSSASEDLSTSFYKGGIRTAVFSFSLSAPSRSLEGRVGVGWSVLSFSLSLTLFTLFFFFPSSASAAILGKPPNNLGLVGYWSLNEGTGTKATDSSGNGNTGTLNGSATWVKGRMGKAMTFDGASDYVDVGVGTGSLDQLGNTFTMSAWIKTSTPTARMTIFSTGYSGSGPMFGTSANTPGGLEIYLPGVYVAYTGASLLATDTWQHVVYTRSGTGSGTHTFYINGVSQALSSDTASNFTDTAVNKYIGYRPGVMFNGQIDDVRVYKRALTAAQVASLYGSGAATRKGVSENSLSGYWKFDEATTTNAGDSSNKGYHGTLTAGASGSNTTIAGMWELAGKLGSALKLDGTDDYATLTGSSAWAFGTGDFTVSLWMKATTWSAFEAPFSNGVYGAGWDGFHFERTAVGSGCTPDTAGRIVFVPVGPSICSTTTISTGVWYHVVGVRQSGTAYIYINGVQESSGAAAGNADVARNALVGRNPDNTYPRYFNGRVDDVRVYGRALTAAEILSMYKENAQKINSSQNTRLTSGLVGLWSFNGGDISNGVALDRSGSGNNGNLFNIATSTFYTAGKVGQGFSFDGTDDRIAISAPLNAYPFTVSMWATHNTDWNPAGAGTMDQLLNMSIAGQRVSLGIVDAWDANGEMTIMYGGTSHWGATKPSTVTPNDWHHIVWVVEGSNDTDHKIYVDGVSQTMTDRAGGHGGTAGWSIGSNNTGAEYWDGKIDEVRIYNRMLSVAEVKQLYVMGR